MRRLLAVLTVAFALTGAAQADTFTVVGGTAALPSASVPNAPGDIVMPLAILTPPEHPQVLSYSQLLALWQEAGEAYGVPWELLASIMQIESGFGRDMGPSSADAVGWMQFLPSTWVDWGVDANGDGIADPWNATDAVYAAARYLVASGAHEDLPAAVFSYNHSQDYVAAVLSGATRFATDPLGAGFGLLDLPAASGPSIPELQQSLEEERQQEAALSDRIALLEDELEQGSWALEAARQRAGDPTLSDAAFAEGQAAVDRETQAETARRQDLDLASLELQQATAEVVRLEQDLAIATAEGGSGTFEGLLPAPPTEAARRVIDYALSQVGIPYRWGGNHGFSLEDMVATDPDIANGFDCSSLLAWSFARGAGLYAGDWTGSQWEYGETAPGAVRGPGPAQDGTVPPGGFLPGDLIFFNDTDHVALYIGNDLFVHAPHTGDVVRVARLSAYTPVWGWVRYDQISGIDAPEAAPPATNGERVFTIVIEQAPAAAGILEFAR